MAQFESRGAELKSGTIEARHEDYVSRQLSRFAEDHPLLAGIMGLEGQIPQGDVSDPEILAYVSRAARKDEQP